MPDPRYSQEASDARYPLFSGGRGTMGRSAAPLQHMWREFATVIPLIHMMSPLFYWIPTGTAISSGLRSLLCFETDRI